MPNTSSFGAETDNAVVSGTVTDRQIVIPDIPPQGLMSVGPRATYHYVKEPWNAETSYQFNDVVRNDKGASYVAVKPTIPAGTALTDEEYWFKWNDPDAKFDELEEVVKLYNGRITANENGIAANEERITANETEIVANEERITANENGIAANEERITANENGIAANEERITANENGIDFQNKNCMPIVKKPKNIISYNMPEKFKGAKTDGFTATKTHFYISRRTAQISAVLKINRATLEVEKIAEFSLTKPGFNHMNSFFMFEGDLIVQDGTGATRLNSNDLSVIDENTTCALYKASQVAYRDGKYAMYIYENFILCDYDKTTKILTPHLILGRNIHQTYCQGLEFTDTHIFASCNAGDATNYLYIKTWNGCNQYVISIDHPIELQDIYYNGSTQYIADAEGNIVEIYLGDLSYYYEFDYNSSMIFRSTETPVAIAGVPSSIRQKQTPMAGFTPYNAGAYYGLALVEGMSAFLYSYDVNLHAIGFEVKGDTYEIHTAAWKYIDNEYVLQNTVVIKIDAQNQITKTIRTTPSANTCIKYLYAKPRSIFFAEDRPGF